MRLRTSVWLFLAAAWLVIMAGWAAVESQGEALALQRVGLPVVFRRATVPKPKRTPPSGTLIFADDFDDGTMSGWAAASGQWSNPRDYLHGQDEHPPLRTVRAIKAVSGSDVGFEATVRVISGYTGGLLFRCNADGTRGYEVGISPMDNLLKLGVLGELYASLATSPLTVEPGRAYVVRVEADGSGLAVYLDGVKRLSATDSTYASGYFGTVIRGAWYASRGICEYDDMMAWELP